MNFQNSQTKDNLMRAFAGESQARNRYTFAGAIAAKKGHHMLADVFYFTANQEKEHAEIFYNHLKELTGKSIMVDGSYPVDTYDDVLSLLKSARHNEYEEYEDVYPHFGTIAREEGFHKIAQDFFNIAEIEKTHGRRFEKMATLLENGQLYASQQPCCWMCLNCGFVFEGTQAPQQCPVCLHDQGYFIRLKDAPFSCENDNL